MHQNVIPFIPVHVKCSVLLNDLNHLKSYLTNKSYSACKLSIVSSPISRHPLFHFHSWGWYFHFCGEKAFRLRHETRMWFWEDSSTQKLSEVQSFDNYSLKVKCCFGVCSQWLCLAYIWLWYSPESFLRRLAVKPTSLRSREDIFPNVVTSSQHPALLCKEMSCNVGSGPGLNG